MAQDRPQVSILVPCYNCEAFLGETLDTVLSQTFTDWECILVDDASTDRSLEVISSYAERDSRFHSLALPENLGAAGARNAGLEKVRGRYLAFLDADDIWLPEKLEKQVALIGESQASIVHTSYRFVDEAGEFLPGGVTASREVDLAVYMRNTEIGMSTSLLDREQVGEISFRDIRLCQDTHLWLALLRQGHVARGLPEVLVHYRVREGQISGSKIGMARQVLALYLEIEELGLPLRWWRFFNYAYHGFHKRIVTPES